MVDDAFVRISASLVASKQAVYAGQDSGFLLGLGDASLALVVFALGQASQMYYLSLSPLTSQTTH